jgi:excisionase family DNA binding protein
MKETCKVLTVPEAGAQLGLGRNASYEAAKRGDIPTLRLGKLLRVPKAALDRLLNGSLSPACPDLEHLARDKS